jgi:hypothetical protein
MASTALAEDVSWEYAGRIGVDTGMVIVGDPRYFATPDADEHPAKDWKAFLGLLRREQHRGIAQLHYRQGHAGLGVVVGGVGGDGVFPVYVRRDGNMVAEMRVNFLAEPEPEEEPKREPEREGWRCVVCDEADDLAPMFHDEIWHRMGMGKRDVLCTACARARLGRTIHDSELTVCSWNALWVGRQWLMTREGEMNGG